MARLLSVCALIIGIMIFSIGSNGKHEYEVQSYHKIYKDTYGEYQGYDNYFLAEKSNGTEKHGLVFIIAGGVGIATSKKV